MGKLYTYRKQAVLLLIFLFILTSFFVVKLCTEEIRYYTVADFEPIETVYMIWSDEDSTLIASIAAKISKYENFSIITGTDTSEQTAIKNKILRNKGNLDNITFIQTTEKPKNTWIRDFSPVYLKSSKKITSLKFTYWDQTISIADVLAEKNQISIKRSPIYSLGGTREFNGKGTGIFVLAHEQFTNLRQNTNLLKFEATLKEQLQLKKIIWLQKGIPQDELPTYGPIDENIFPLGSNNHIDEFCRFIAPDKIMISYLPGTETQNKPILVEAKKRLDENIRILRNSTDQDGNPFEIILTPFAPVIIRPFDESADSTDYATYVTSYMNFLITNHTLIVPSYLDIDTTFATRKKEEYLAYLFRKHFPEKEIIFINSGSINSRGGGIHCLTASKPSLSNPGPVNVKLRTRKRPRT